MYNEFYGFHEKPFAPLPDPDFLYMSNKHEMALTYLEYGITSQAGFMVLTGEIGSGKTTLLNYLLKKIDAPDTHVAFVFNTNIQPLDFLEAVLKEWDVPYNKPVKSHLYERLNEFLLSAYRQNARVILIVDEAQNLPIETFEEIRMISNLNDEKIPLLYIVFSGQPDLKQRLNSPELEQLRQRIGVHYHLEPLDRQETSLYITNRLARAGYTGGVLFTETAADRIFFCSRGIPRIINVLCDLCLVYGFAEQIKEIDCSVVEMVVSDREQAGLPISAAPEHSADRQSAGDGSAGGSAVTLEMLYSELNNNVYELTRMLNKMMESKKVLEKQKRSINGLSRRIEALEKKLFGASGSTLIKAVRTTTDKARKRSTA